MKRTNEKIVEKAVTLRKQGWSYARIGRQLAVSPTTVMNHFNRRCSVKSIEKHCLLPECQQLFRTLDPRQVCCCRSHIKRFCNRRLKAICVDFTECALPECKQKIARIGPYRKFCSKKHAALNLRRWGRKHKGQTGKYEFYYRLLGFGQPCAVCGEKYVVDEHHVVHQGNKSDKRSKTIYLCPTHHMAIHRGFAVLTETGFKWLIDDIKIGLNAKQPKAAKQMASYWAGEATYPNQLHL